MANKFAFRFSPKALIDLEKTLYYIEKELFNPKAAEDLAAKLFREIEIIAEFPESGLKVDNEYIADQTLRKIVVDNYLIFYKIDEKNEIIIIIRIVYGRRNINEILRIF